MARDEEFFRKLSKQKPIIKRKDIQPLSSRDFDVRKRSLELTGTPKRVSSKPAEIDVFGKSQPDTGRRSRKQQPLQSGSLNVFGDKAKMPARQAGKRAPRKKETPLQVPIPPQREKRSQYQMPRRTETEPVLRTDYMQFQAPLDKLAFRHELKYYINYHDYVLLRNTLRPLLAIDRNAGSDGNYHIRSLYFDDVDDSALREKMAGKDDRHKYRIRIYNYSDSVIRFEKKIKKGQFISKKSIMLSREDCDSLIAGDYNVLEGREEPLAAELLLQMKSGLRPRVIVDYWREAYVSPFGNVRITFDKDLKGGLWVTDIFNPNAPTMPMLDEGLMVLEVKFDRYLPVHIRAVLNNVQGAQRSAISKYVICRKYD